jgi:hypothetical protein
MSIAVAERRVPRQPGLYAVYGSPKVWLELRLGRRPDDRPLYVGKAERSLLGRDLGQHFNDGKTGWSTLRRSLAALLRETLQLRGIPRDTVTPGDFDRFGLSALHDARLTAWMRSRLWIAVWPAPDGTQLKAMEDDLKVWFGSPLNLDKASRWQEFVRTERRVMADQARAWAARRS